MKSEGRKRQEGDFRYPRYGELPDRLMFARELAGFVNRVHGPLPARVRRNRTFTVAMATNYVKGGLTPPAIGRRYGRDHLALILFAATAKLCFSAGEVMWLAARLFDASDMQASHDRLAVAFDEAFSGGKPTGRAGAVACALKARCSALDA